MPTRGGPHERGARSGAHRIRIMSVDRIVMMIAGFMVLASLGLGLTVSPYFFWLTAFVGANLMQASVTGFCPAAMLLKQLGVKPGVAFN